MTYKGGTKNNGTVFKIKSDGTAFSKIHDFGGSDNGILPDGSLITDGTFLYGMTYGGGETNCGVIFKIKKDGTQYSKLLDFTNADNGCQPRIGSLYFDGTFLYGMTSRGGVSNNGVIFKIKPDGTQYTILHQFTGGTAGSQGVASLISDGTYLYGITWSGYGEIFKIMPNGTGFTELYNFTYTTGIQPSGSLISVGNYLYGTTFYGGIYGNCVGYPCGTLYRIKNDGSDFLQFLSFGGGGVDERIPIGSLLFENNSLYGITQGGGANSRGVIYKINTDGNGYTDIFDFTTYASGTLISDGDFMYGTTRFGGSTNNGTIFKIIADGTGYTNLFDFPNLSDGRDLNGSLLSDGVFLYGMTHYGGAHDLGTIFKYQYNPNPDTGVSINENITEIDFTVSPNPFTTSTTLQTNKVFKNATLTLCNSLGQEVKNITNIFGNSIVIYRENLPSGLYFLQLTQDNTIFSTEKIVITDK